MLEARASELPESDLLEAIDLAAKRLAPLLAVLAELRGEGKPKRSFDAPAQDSGIREAVEREAAAVIAEAAATAEKQNRGELLRRARTAALEALAILFAGREEEVADEVERLTSRIFRSTILDSGRRADGRSTTQIRPIRCEAGCLPRVHGSALFTRGETQALVVCTLGTGRDEQEVEGLAGIEREAFQLYYRFPSYSVGEVRPLRGPGRREIGHGNLARRALEAVLPASESFPYTIKIESEITSSNGSSSMATVCGGCLALMDAGVPVRRPVAGIAMGLIREGDRIAILSDILGDEDHLGDMDFKVAGTESGVTAVQLDNKLGSLPFSLLEGAMGQAREGRIHILREMAKAIAKPRASLSLHAPRVQMLKIGVHRIRDLIGPGGRAIQAVQADTGSKIDVSDDGTVRIYTQDAASLEHALRRVRDLTGRTRDREDLPRHRHRREGVRRLRPAVRGDRGAGPRDRAGGRPCARRSPRSVSGRRDDRQGSRSGRAGEDQTLAPAGRQCLRGRDRERLKRVARDLEEDRRVHLATHSGVAVTRSAHPAGIAR